MNGIAAAIIVAAMLTVPALAAADVAPNRANEPISAGMHEKHDGQGAQGTGTHGSPSPGHKTDRHHRHKVIAVVVYVPDIRPVNAPYFYAPDTPVFVDQDPPEGAYRELNGFYYWCNEPAGYYPYQPDCPTGWRLVAP
jgi:hypothetical protein